MKALLFLLTLCCFLLAIAVDRKKDQPCLAVEAEIQDNPYRLDMNGDSTWFNAMTKTSVLRQHVKRSDLVISISDDSSCPVSSTTQEYDIFIDRELMRVVARQKNLLIVNRAWKGTRVSEHETGSTVICGPIVWLAAMKQRNSGEVIMSMQITTEPR